MTQTPPPATTLPHHKLFAYELCLSLVKLVAKTRVADAQLRAQARKIRRISCAQLRGRRGSSNTRRQESRVRYRALRVL